ncbi:rho GTPase-activating protein, partial [Plakobranchus ocellatus]
SMPMTFQALSDDDRRMWLDAMDGKEPTYQMHNIKTEDTMLDDVGFNFMRRSIAAIEARGLAEQGLYRVVGVNSKVNNLLKVALDSKKADKVNYDDPSVWETKTITSAVKSYLRTLPEPLMTFKLHESFIKASKQESKTLRILDVHKYVHQLPESNFEMLDMLIAHLKRVSEEAETNKMTVANLGVCFGPSLMRPEEESMAAIMDIKFCNIVVEILITNYEQIFKTPPDGTDPSESRVLPSSNNSSNNPAVLRPHANALGSASKHPEPVARPVSSIAAIGRNTNHSGNAPSRIYANQAPIHPHAGARTKQRPVQIFNANTGGFEVHSSTSSSTESLNSAKNALSPRQLGGGPWGGASPLVDKGPPRRGSGAAKESQPTYSNVSALVQKGSGGSPIHLPSYGSAFQPPSRFNLNSSGSDVPTLSTSMHGSLTGSVSSLSSSKPTGRTVITRYPCVADNYTELSFEANQLITDVRPTPEEGWLQGTLNGKTGIIPMNHVEFID